MSFANLREPQPATHLFAHAFARPLPAAPPSVADNRDVPHTGVSITRNDYGTMIYDLNLVPGDDHVHTGLFIPPGWEGRVEAHVDLDHTTARDYEITGIGDIQPSHPFDVTLPSVCSTDAPREIMLHVYSRKPGQVRLIVQPTLRAAKC